MVSIFTYERRKQSYKVAGSADSDRFLLPIDKMLNRSEIHYVLCPSVSLGSLVRNVEPFLSMLGTDFSPNISPCT